MTTEIPNNPAPELPAPPNRRTTVSEEQLALAEIRLRLALIRHEIQSSRCEGEAPKQERVRL